MCPLGFLWAQGVSGKSANTVVGQAWTWKPVRYPRLLRLCEPLGLVACRGEEREPAVYLP